MLDSKFKDRLILGYNKFLLPFIIYLFSAILAIYIIKLFIIMVVPAFWGKGYPIYVETSSWASYLWLVLESKFLALINVSLLFSILFILSFLGRFKIILYSLLFIVFTADILIFHFFNFFGKLPSYEEALQVTDIANVFNAINMEVPFLLILIEIIVTIFLFLLWQKLFKKWFNQLNKRVVLFIFSVFIIVTIAGKGVGKVFAFPFEVRELSQAPILNIVDSYIKVKKEQQDITTNIKTIDLDFLRQKLYSTSNYSTLGKNVLLARKKKDPVSINNKIAIPKKYNVILFIIESASSNIAGLKVKDKVIGEQFLKIKRDGLSFNNFYSSGILSVGGLEAIFYSSYPRIMNLYKKYQTNISLIHILRKNGYFTKAFSSAPRYWFSLGHMLNTIGHNSVYDPLIFKKEFGLNEDQKYILYHDRFPDHDMLEVMYKYLKGYDKKKPYFLSFVSSINHSPFAYYPKSGVPKVTTDPNIRDKNFLNTFNYSIESIANFIEKCKKLPEFDNTIFIITADHAAPVNINGLPGIKKRNFIELSSIPLIIYNPKVITKSKMIESRIGSQLDIAPTILSLLGISENRTAFMGQSLLTKDFNTDRFVLLPRRTAIYKDFAVTRNKVLKLGLGINSLEDITKSHPELLADFNKLSDYLVNYTLYYKNISVKKKAVKLLNQ